jgi:hypothetical protein
LICFFVLLVPVASQVDLATTLPELTNLSMFKYGRSPKIGGQNFTYCCLRAVDEHYKPDGDGGITIRTANNSYGLGASELSGLQFPCGASYQGSNEGAPLVSVPYHWCTQKCGGWQKSKNEALNQWVQPFVGFILPAVAFCLPVRTPPPYQS